MVNLVSEGIVKPWEWTIRTYDMTYDIYIYDDI